MLAWVIEASFAFILQLMAWQEEGALGEAKAAVSLLTAVLLPLGGFFLFIRAQARRQYQKGLDEVQEARRELANRDEVIARDRAEKREKDQRIALLERMAPDGFARTMDAHHRDGNTEHEVRDALAYLDFHRTALRRAHGVIVDDLIGHAATEGPATFAIALSHAQAALAYMPDDAMLRELAAELEQAATIGPGVRVVLPSAEERADRLAEREALPNDLQALGMAWQRAWDRGQYQLALTLARHGVRSARRGFGAASEGHVVWANCEAWALLGTGQPSAALSGLRTLLPAAKATLGAEHPEVLETLYLTAHCIEHTGDAPAALQAARDLLPGTRRVNGAEHQNTLATLHLIASCLQDTGDVLAALQEARDLLPVRVRVQGAAHPGTLTTRCLIASCLQDTGDAPAALQAARDLLPVEAHVKGAEHPHTLATRHLIASCLQDTGDAPAALQAARDLLPVMERVKGAAHPDTLTTRHLIARCLQATGDAPAALQAARDLLPVEERVRGAGHPHTLTTRSLLASILLDLGQTAEAAEVHRGVSSALAAAGLRPEHRYMRRAVEVDARLTAT